MSSLMQEIVVLVLQYLKEHNLVETMHMLEKESLLFFNMEYFEEKIKAREWDEADKYLSAFTKVEDNNHSKKTFFEIRKHNYLEALYRKDKARAIEILAKDLKVFSNDNEDLYKDLAYLLTLDNFRDNELLSKYEETLSAQNIMTELKKLLESNLVLRDKLTFPSIQASRLRLLINQSLNWQHSTCANPLQHPDIITLFTDHSCSPPNEPLTDIPVTSDAPQGGAHSDPTTPAVASNVALVEPLAYADPITHADSPVIPDQVFNLSDSTNDPVNPVMIQSSSAQSVEGIDHAPPRQRSRLLGDLPRTVVCTLHQGSKVTSIDFSPSSHSLLVVGCENGEVSLWDAGLRERLTSQAFETWNISACSAIFQAIAKKDMSISVSRVSWSPERDFIGVAFSKHLIHLYVYQAPNVLQHHLEIDAHVGGVNDLVFFTPDIDLNIVSCGDDKIIKVWDLTGQNLYKYEGHLAPVYSVCPYQNVSVQFLVSTSLDGNIKEWVCGNNVDYDDAPGKWCTRMLYNPDGCRLFSCGTSKQGDSFLVEWNHMERRVKTTYNGFRNDSYGIVQFDMAKNRFLAAGEDNRIKFWDINKRNLLTSTDADGGLCSVPCLRFNKEGNLLAVTTSLGGVKILGNATGIQYLRAIQAWSNEKSKASVDPKNGVEYNERKRKLDEFSEDWELTKIVNPVQCRTITIPDGMGPTNKVVCLLYTNSGAGLLALGSKGTQKLWKWNMSELNPSGKATTRVVPQEWKPKRKIRMINDVPKDSEGTVAYMALTKNGAYVLAACGGKISLFNLHTFKVIETFMPPPPAATFFAFHPRDNNIIVVGTQVATIHVYEVWRDAYKAKLRGHQKHITGLVFSTQLNILVSAGADAQLIFWSMDSWEKKTSLSLQMPDGSEPVGDTRLEFHTNQVFLLVCHQTQIAIYDASRIELVWKWMPQKEMQSTISSATFSSNSQLVYVALTDGIIGVFDTDFLRLRCLISPSAYLHDQNSSYRKMIYPVVVRGHPQESNQFAIGLSDGSIRVIEPTESAQSWGQ